jgi:hypothetical protein
MPLPPAAADKSFARFRAYIPKCLGLNKHRCLRLGIVVSANADIGTQDFAQILEDLYLTIF